MKEESPAVFTRSTLAARAGTGVETLRFYEREGLVSPPKRNASGYRIYSESDLERLRFIKRAQELGFSLAEIRQLLLLTGNFKAPRGKVKAFAESRLGAIRQKIRDLRAMERALGGLVGQCDGRGALKGCPIVEFVCGKRQGGKRHE